MLGLAEETDSFDTTKSDSTVLVLDNCISYSEGRSIQEDLVEKRRRGQIVDTWFFCEHFDTVTLGKRTSARDIKKAKELKRDFDLHHVSRGGELSVHCPGIYMIYPVVDIREKGAGVRDFVISGLEAIREACSSIELSKYGEFFVDQCRPAVWFKPHIGAPKKLASVGLKFEGAVSNHGFSVNIDNSLDLISKFDSCGLSGDSYSTLLEECRSRKDLKEYFNPLDFRRLIRNKISSI